MPTADAIRWFKTQFHSQIEAGVKGTPFTLRSGTSKHDWWKDTKFAEFAFWLHA